MLELRVDPPPPAEDSRSSHEVGRMPQLDGLRALAAIAIIAQHTLAHRVNWGAFYHFQPAISVRLFFVLSGFLITAILLRARARVDASGGASREFFVFYARRSLRIFPLYYLVLLLAWAARLPDVRQALPWHAAYISNFYYMKIGRFPQTLAQFWTLSVEEQFYLIWPTVLLLMPIRRLVPIFVALIILSPLAYLAYFLETRSELIAYVSTLGNVDALAAGALLAWFVDRKGPKTQRATAIALAIGSCLCCLSIGLTAMTIAFPVQLLLARVGTVLTFVWLVHGASKGFKGPVGSLLAWEPLRYVGSISYGIYVYHLLIPTAFIKTTNRLGMSQPWPSSGWSDFSLMLLGSVLVATISWFAFEKPINALKKYVPYR